METKEIQHYLFNLLRFSLLPFMRMFLTPSRDWVNFCQKTKSVFFLTFWNHHLKTFWQLPIGVSYDVENDLINFKAFLVKWKIKDIIPTNIMQRTKRYQNIPDNMDEAYFTNATVTTMGAIFNCFSARYTFNSIF